MLRRGSKERAIATRYFFCFNAAQLNMPEINKLNSCYSYRKATIGSNFEAL